MSRGVDVDQMRLRVVQDAFAEALAITWTRRAGLCEWARPRPSDFRGLATAEDVQARDARLAGAAMACRRRASLALQERLAPEDEAIILGAAS